jgi:hypothetical protein
MGLAFGLQGAGEAFAKLPIPIPVTPRVDQDVKLEIVTVLP